MSAQTNNNFDFSLDALEFKKKLEMQLRQMMLQELDDDELDCVNAAGLPDRLPKEDKP